MISPLLLPADSLQTEQLVSWLSWLGIHQEKLLEVS